MADIGITNCEIQHKNEGGYTQILILTPATADSNDTVDVSTLVPDGDLCGLVGWDVTSGDSVTATYATGTGVITVDAAGGTTNHMYALELTKVGKPI